MLQAGFARVDITPPFGTEMSGSYEHRFADGTLDPLYVNALALSDENGALLLMTADYLGIKRDHVLALQGVISQRTGVDAERIFIAALHPHTSPCLIHPKPHDTPDRPIRDEAFLDVLYRRFADAAQMAMDDRHPATVSTAARETAEPIAFVRRYFTKEAGVKTNPSSKYTLTGRCDEADPTVRLVRFRREGAKDIALINFGTHPDVVGGTKWSADWPGFVRRFVEQDNENVHAIFFMAPQGDSNHIDFFKPKDERIKDNNGYTHSRYMGRTVADAVREMWEHTTPLEDDTRLFAVTRTLYTKTNAEGMERFEECERFYEIYEEGRTPDDPWAAKNRAQICRVVALREQPLFRPIPLSAFGIGHVVLVGFGGEPFSAYGRLVRALAPDQFTLCVALAGGHEGYFPTEEAFAQGGFEVDTSFFTPSVQNEILDTIEEMLTHI